MSIRPAAVEAFERQILAAGKPVIERMQAWIDAPNAPKVESEFDRYALANILSTMKQALPTMEAVQKTSVFGNNYEPVLLGMTRQIFSRLIGKEVAAIQPLDRPTGKIFHLNLLRDDNSNPANLAGNLASRTYADHPLPTAGEAVAIQKGMRLSITGSDVAVNTSKKLKTEASLELAQDLQAYHNLNAMELLQGAATDEIAREIDGMLVQAAWAAAQANRTITCGLTAPTGWAPKDWRQRAFQRAVLLADNQIYTETGRNGNVILCGPEAYLEMADASNTFQLNPNLSTEDASYGMQVVGTLANQYKVIRSRYLPSNEMVLLRKGGGLLDAGLVYAPYIALFVSERFFDVELQRSVQSFAHRSLIHTVSNDLFVRIVVDQSANSVA